MTIPYDPRGYAVDEARAIVHLRHAAHAAGLRRTSFVGVGAFLYGRPAKPCAECWPAQPEPPQSDDRHKAGEYEAELDKPGHIPGEYLDGGS